MTGRTNPYRCSHCGCDEPILGIDGKLYCDNCGMSLEKLEGGVTMAKNKMAQVAALFGKKLGEPFYVNDSRCVFSEKGFGYGKNDVACHDTELLEKILTGRAEIVEVKK